MFPPISCSHNDKINSDNLIKVGEAKISIQSVDDFADKNLVRPTSYEYANTGNQKITINEKKIETETTIENEKTNVISNKQDNTVANVIIPKTGIKRVMPLLIIPIIIIIPSSIPIKFFFFIICSFHFSLISQ